MMRQSILSDAGGCGAVRSNEVDVAQVTTHCDTMWQLPDQPATASDSISGSQAGIISKNKLLYRCQQRALSVLQIT